MKYYHADNALRYNGHQNAAWLALGQGAKHPAYEFYIYERVAGTACGVLAIDDEDLSEENQAKVKALADLAAKFGKGELVKEISEQEYLDSIKKKPIGNDWMTPSSTPIVQPRVPLAKDPVRGQTAGRVIEVPEVPVEEERPVEIQEGPVEKVEDALQVDTVKVSQPVKDEAAEKIAASKLRKKGNRETQ